MQTLPYCYQLLASITWKFILLIFFVPLKCLLSVRLSIDKHGGDVQMENSVFRVFNSDRYAGTLLQISQHQTLFVRMEEWKMLYYVNSAKTVIAFHE